MRLTRLRLYRRPDVPMVQIHPLVQTQRQEDADQRLTLEWRQRVAANVQRRLARNPTYRKIRNE